MNATPPLPFAPKPRLGHRLNFGPRCSRCLALLGALTALMSLTGCFGFLKPAKNVTQQFVLTPLPAAGAAAAAPGSLAVGVGPVKIPSYLFNSSLAVRKGANEVDYLPLALWADRLDNNLQRVIAANLGTLLPTDQIRLSAWQSDDVAAGVYVTFDRFDVDSSGQANLVAWWRILSPGGEKTLKAGEARLTRAGPSPDNNPSAAVATLSDLVGELSRQLAQAIKESTVGNNAQGTH